ncbi:MAG TPA: hypothetical protein PKW90_05310, partial [Myxococcota bacterium]|nr:hypothetical protein [Myxococcota bacterium]
MKSALPILALLGALVLALTVGTTDRFPAADGPHMLSQALRLGTMLRGGDVPGVAAAMFQLSAPHPPFAYLPLVGLAALGLPLRAIVGIADLLWLLLLL